MTAIKRNSGKTEAGTPGIYSVGPLRLNRDTKRVSTVTGSELSLTENEFDALQALVADEGEPLSFEKLYEAAWQGGNEDFAKSSLNHLIKQVGEAGEGFVWIEKHPQNGYTLFSKWSDNWKRETTIQIFSDIENTTIIEPRTWHNKISKTILSGMAILVASITLFAILIHGKPTPENDTGNDEPVPLTSAPTQPCEEDCEDEDCDCREREDENTAS